MAEKPKGFLSSDVKRIGEAVRYVESLPRASGLGPSGRGPVSQTIAHLWVRITATSIGPRSGANCTSGAALILNVSDAGVFSDSSTSITVWNGTDSTLAGGAGKYYEAHWAQGKWWVGVPGSCTFLS